MTTYLLWLLLLLPVQAFILSPLALWWGSGGWGVQGGRGMGEVSSMVGFVRMVGWLVGIHAQPVTACMLVRMPFNRPAVIASQLSSAGA